MVDLAVAIPTLVGSIVSMFAAGCIIFCYIVLPPQRHFRHTLILNLATADCINGLNNTISGIYAFAHKSIPSGIPCSINGTVGQVTVQATDFSVLFISIATVFTLRKFNYKPTSTKTTKFLLTLGIWYVPLTTGVTGLFLKAYQPVSGNWCWLSASDPVLRYALGHGWRLTIIFSVICLHTYLFIYMHRHFAALREIEALNIDFGKEGSTAGDLAASADSTYEYNEFEVFHEFEDGYLRTEIPISEANLPNLSISEVKGVVSIHGAPASDPKDIQPPLSPSIMMRQIIHPHGSKFTKPNSFGPIDERASLLTRDPLALVRRPPPTNLTPGFSTAPTQRITIKAREFQIQKLLLLNAYPIGYILLWIPGILNRLAESSGRECRALGIAQSSTQFVGLANALVYGYNERIWTLATLWWESKRCKRKTGNGVDRPTTTMVVNQDGLC